MRFNRPVVEREVEAARLGGVLLGGVLAAVAVDLGVFAEGED